jgi:galactosylceramidase
MFLWSCPGAFEIYATNSTRGNVMRQSVPELPICWSGDYAPFSVIGSEKWSDTIVSVDVLLEVRDNTCHVHAVFRP